MMLGIVSLYFKCKQKTCLLCKVQQDFSSLQQAGLTAIVLVISVCCSQHRLVGEKSVNSVWVSD